MKHSTDIVCKEKSQVKFSIVAPVFNEEASLNILYKRIKDAMRIYEGGYEIIFVNDGSSDASEDILKELAIKDENVKTFMFSHNRGQHKALEAGFHNAQGEIVITLDADLQNDPCNIPKLIAKMDEGFDLVCGWRSPRNDPWHKVLKSRIANFIQRKVTKIRLHDMSCTLRAYKRDIVRNLVLRDRYEVLFITYII